MTLLFNQGTVTATNGDSNLLFIGAGLLPAHAQHGDEIVIGAYSGFLDTVNHTAQTATIKPPYSGTTGSDKAYTIRRATPISVSASDAVERVFKLLNDISVFDSEGVGLLYSFNDSVADADPTTQKLSVNNVDPSLVTKINLSTTEGKGKNITSIPSIWRKSTVVLIRSIETASYFAYVMSGPATVTGSRIELDVTYVGHDGYFLNNEPLVFGYSLGVDYEYLDDSEAAAAASAAEALGYRNTTLGYRDEVEADRAEVATNTATVAADRAIVAADKATVNTDKGIVAADKATVAADKATVNTDKGIVAADKATVAADKAIVAADKLTTEGYKDTAVSSANVATTQAGISTTQAGIATTKAGEAAATLTELKDKWLAAASSDPTVDGNGGALSGGEAYVNTVTQKIRVYTGAVWQDMTAASNPIYHAFTTDGTVGPYTLPEAPASKYHTFLTIGGQAVLYTDYDIAGNQLTLGGVIDTGLPANILMLNVLGIGEPSDETVTADKIATSDLAAIRAKLSVLTSAEIATLISNAVAGVLDSAPGALDTLNELAAALGDDANFATTVTTALAGKERKSLFTASDDTSDWNTITTAGWHPAVLLGHLSHNGPRDGTYYFLLTISYNGVSFTQIAFPYAGGFSSLDGIYTRGKYDSDPWLPWSKIYSSRNSPALSALDAGEIRDEDLPARLNSNPTLLTDANSAVVMGQYICNPSTLNRPPDGGSGEYWVLLVSSYGAAGNYLIQTAVHIADASLRLRRYYNSGIWSAWVQLEDRKSVVHDATLLTGVVPNGRLPSRLTNTLVSITTYNDANTVPSETGSYYMALSINTPTAYGFLVVVAYDATFLTQQFTDSSTGGIWARSKTSSVWSSWRRIYKADTILGAVAQSSGVPTGAIIERGSNANGEYTKFADGTLICSVYKSVNATVTAGTSVGAPTLLPAAFSGGAAVASWSGSFYVGENLTGDQLYGAVFGFGSSVNSALLNTGVRPAAAWPSFTIGSETAASYRIFGIIVGRWF